MAIELGGSKFGTTKFGTNNGTTDLPAHTSLREMIEAMLRKFGEEILLPDQWSTTNTIQRRNEVWAGPRFGAGGLIETQHLH